MVSYLHRSLSKGYHPFVVYLESYYYLNPYYKFNFDNGDDVLHVIDGRWWDFELILRQCMSSNTRTVTPSLY